MQAAELRDQKLILCVTVAYFYYLHTLQITVKYRNERFEALREKLRKVCHIIC